MDRAEIVSGRWLVKAILTTLIAAGFALYFTVCLLFYQGQWQFTFFPSGRIKNIDLFAGSWARRTGPPSPHAAPQSAADVAALSGLPITDVRFDYTELGAARLDGWWIPARADDGNARNVSAPDTSSLSRFVVLFCPNGSTVLPENLGAMRAFHALGVSVFAFDYRGFGASQGGHPSQNKSYADGLAALNYLTGIRHIDSGRIVVYGAELGSAVAAQAARQSPDIAGLILENSQPSLANQVKREQHIHLLPMWLVFTDRFDISRIVPALKMPKLIIATSTKPEYESGAAEIYRETAGPRQMARIQISPAMPLYTQAEWRSAVGGFLQAISAKTVPQSR
ncbi:MAG: alpha/beta fold hydrolase [Acidobacteriaceae bacterium]